MHPVLSRLLLGAAAAVVVAYLGYQGLRRGFDGRYLSYTSLDLEDARTAGLLLGEYQSSCTGGPLAAIRAYAVRPTTKDLGYLFVGTRITVPDAVTVRVSDVPEQLLPSRLRFDDGAGLYMGVDGGDKPIRPVEAPGTETYGPNVSGCCSSNRSRVPKRFWLTDRDGVRLCAFVFDEATRRDVPPQTRWTW